MAALTMEGPPLTRHSCWLRRPVNISGWRSCTELMQNCFGERAISARPKEACKRQLTQRANRARNPGSYGRQLTWRVFTKIVVTRKPRVQFCSLSIAGTPRRLIQLTCAKPAPCWQISIDTNYGIPADAPPHVISILKALLLIPE